MLIVSPNLYKRLERHHLLGRPETRVEAAARRRTTTALGHLRRRRDRRAMRAAGFRGTRNEWGRKLWRGVHAGSIPTQNGQDQAFRLSWTTVGPSLDPDIARIIWGA